MTAFATRIGTCDQAGYEDDKLGLEAFVYLNLFP
jgi:hypothetical protein